MRRTIPLALLLALGCGGADEGTDTPKSRTNERGEIERHLRRVPAAPLVEPEASRPVAAVDPAASPARAARAPHRAAPRAPAPAAAGTLRPDRELAATRAIAEPAPEAIPEPATASPQPSVELVRVVVASAVEGREPVGASPFGVDVDNVFLFIEARNEGGPGSISVRWVQPDGTELRAVELGIPTSRRWRTWATTSRVSGRTGTWTAIVADEAGHELARERFDVAPAPSA